MNAVEKSLYENGVYTGKTQGDSMEPMLKEGRDTVIIVSPKFPLKKYDVPVYRRDDHITMHRIIKCTKKGYIICGDNRSYLEKDIKDSDIIGVLSGFYHNGRYVDVKDKAYIKYARKIKRKIYLRIVKKYIRVVWRKLLFNELFRLMNL